MSNETIDTERVALRIVKGLVTMRGAAAKLHSASLDRQPQDVRAALNTIDQDIFVAGVSEQSRGTERQI